MQMNCLRLKIKKRIVDERSDTLSNRMVSDQIETEEEKKTKKSEAKNNPIENACEQRKTAQNLSQFLVVYSSHSAVGRSVVNCVYVQC